MAVLLGDETASTHGQIRRLLCEVFYRSVFTLPEPLLKAIAAVHSAAALLLEGIFLFPFLGRPPRPGRGLFWLVSVA